MDMQAQIFEVDAANFEELVIKGSMDRVVVVDFWAPWCGPCKTLGPILEEAVTALGPAAALAKVNVDDNQDLAMAFRVQGIPAVKVLKDGQLVDEFTGALPREQVDALLRKHVPSAPPTDAEITDDALTQARERLEMGDLAGATALYEQLLAADPETAGALVGLARARLLEGRVEDVEPLTSRIEVGTPEYDQGKALLTHVDFHRIAAESGGRGVCAEKLLSDSGDLEARYALGCCAAIEGDYETALQEWFTIMETQRDFRQGAAREAMVSVFHLLGRHHPTVGEYPKRLYQLLY